MPTNLTGETGENEKLWDNNSATNGKTANSNHHTPASASPANGATNGTDKMSTASAARSPSPFDFGGAEGDLDGALGQSDTICPYCHQTYRQPRLLRCLHALCEDCIIAQLERRPDDQFLNRRHHWHRGRGRYHGYWQQQRQQEEQQQQQQQQAAEAAAAAERQQRENSTDSSTTAKENEMVELEPQHSREHKPPPGVIRCPVCKQDSQVGNDIRFVSNLLIDYVTLNMLDTSAVQNEVVLCESCKNKEQAIARCQDCCKMICKNCVQAHQYMKCFDGHEVINFIEMQNENGSGGVGGEATNGGEGGAIQSRAVASVIHRPIFCTSHATEPYRYSCATCMSLVCNECVVSEHRPNDNHRLHKIDDTTDQALREELKKLLEIAEKKVQVVNESHANINSQMEGLKTQVELGREAVQNAFDRFGEILEEHRSKMLQELDDLYGRDERDMNERFKTVANTTEKINDAVRFAQRLVKYGNAIEVLISRDTVTEQLMQLLRSLPSNAPAPNLQYMSDDSQFKNALYGACGYFKNEIFSGGSGGGSGSTNSSARPGYGNQSAQPQGRSIAGGGGNAPPLSILDINPGSVLKGDIWGIGAALNPADLPRQYQQIIQQVMSGPPVAPPVPGPGLVPPGLMPPPPNFPAGALQPPPFAGQLPPNPAVAAAALSAAVAQGGNPAQFNAQLMELAQQIQAAGGAGANVQAALQAAMQHGMAGFMPQQPPPSSRPLVNTAATSVGTGTPQQQAQPFNAAPGAIGGVSTPAPPGIVGRASLDSVQSAFGSTTTPQPGPLTATSRASLDQLSGAAVSAAVAANSNRPLMSTAPGTQPGIAPFTSVAQPNLGLFDRCFTSPLAPSSTSVTGIGGGWPLTSTSVSTMSGTGSKPVSPPLKANTFQPITTTPPVDDQLQTMNLNKDLTPPGSMSDSGGGSNPPVRQTNMAQMQIRHRFGTLGPGHGQFNSPHGFCLGFDEEIVVADTNNHRVQIFTKQAQYIRQFGNAGKEDGQLWYPRKVAVLNRSPDFQFYIVCDRGNERSRMQIFTREGHFFKKIAIRYVDIVAGLAVDSENNTVVAVDSVSPTVFKINIETGELIKWFDCSEYMKEPSDIAVSNKELFICDFKGHCVCVFSEEGRFQRRIGNLDVTSFPNGIDISDAGDVLIGDSHGNRFHVAIYRRTGEFETEFECPSIKVSRCCGLRITSEGLIVTLAKNNHYALVLNTLYVT